MLATLPDDVVACALRRHEVSDDDWLEWNLGRHRAEPLLRAHLDHEAYKDVVCVPEAAR